MRPYPRTRHAVVDGDVEPKAIQTAQLGGQSNMTVVADFGVRVHESVLQNLWP